MSVFNSIRKGRIQAPLKALVYGIEGAWMRPLPGSWRRVK